MRSQDILQLLENLVVKGAALRDVQRACKMFLRRGQKAASVASKRLAIPIAWKLRALKRQHGLCSRCGLQINITKNKWDLTGDHIIPLVDGGLHGTINIAALHKKCNSSKGANTLLEESLKTGKTIFEILNSGQQVERVKKHLPKKDAV